MRRPIAALALALAGALAAETGAEIYRCQGPNGEVRFTSDASQCPEAAPHEPKPGALQRVDEAPPPLTSARPGALSPARRAAPAADSRASEAMWRQKRSAAQQKLATLEAAQERAIRAVRWCNEGHGVVREDPRTGLRSQIPCREIDADRERIDAELESARAYLSGGLEEECRKAGCMPGWIRD